MPDSFEKSLRSLLQDVPSGHDDDACLERVLKTANRQVGAGDLLGVIGHWARALAVATRQGSAHLSPVSRSAKRISNKVNDDGI